MHVNAYPLFFNSQSHTKFMLFRKFRTSSDLMSVLAFASRHDIIDIVRSGSLKSKLTHECANSVIDPSGPNVTML